MPVKLSDHFTFGRLIRFVTPSILMMMFVSMYTVVDGIFVSNAAGADAFAALNLIYPIVQVLGAFGFMMGTGGAALVSKTMGEQKAGLARQRFSLLIVFVVVFGLCLSAAGLLWLPHFARSMGAQGEMYEDCLVYGGTLLAFQVFCFLQNCFQSFIVVAEKPKFGLFVTVLAGLTNMVLDWVFIIPLQLGIAGAAYATTLSWMVGALIPLIYFLGKNPTPLRLVRPCADLRAVFSAMGNGASEMVTNLSVSVANMLYNMVLMKLAGPDGVNAYGIIQYVTFACMAVYFGYSIGISPVISYQYGADNRKELKNLFGKSILFLVAASVLMFGLTEANAGFLAGIFVYYSPELMEMTVHAIDLFAFAYLFSGFNAFASSFFTALNNGGVSAGLSLVRTFVLQITAILVMSYLWGINGLWLAVPASEFCSLLFSLGALKWGQKRYGY